MTTKKIPISFSDKDQKKITELIDLLGIIGVYGDIPKAVKFGINLAVSAIKNPQKVYTHLNDSEMAQYFESIERSEIKQRLLKKAAKLENDAKKV